MKKIISLVLVLAALALVFSACGETNTGIPEGMKLVENDKNTYKLFVPENWTVNLSDGVSGAYANDNSNVSLMIMTASKNYQSLESFCQQYYKDMEATFQNVSEREEYTENQKFGQLPALKYVFTIGAEASETDANAVQYKYMQIFALDQSTSQVYIFTYTAVADKFASHLDDVNRIAVEFIH
jgi:predicted small secreted protein